MKSHQCISNFNLQLNEVDYKYNVDQKDKSIYNSLQENSSISSNQEYSGFCGENINRNIMISSPHRKQHKQKSQVILSNQFYNQLNDYKRNKKTSYKRNEFTTLKGNISPSNDFNRVQKVKQNLSINVFNKLREIQSNEIDIELNSELNANTNANSKYYNRKINLICENNIQTNNHNTKNDHDTRNENDNKIINAHNIKNDHNNKLIIRFNDESEDDLQLDQMQIEGEDQQQSADLRLGLDSSSYSSEDNFNSIYKVEKGIQRNQDSNQFLSQLNTNHNTYDSFNQQLKTSGYANNYHNVQSICCINNIDNIHNINNLHDNFDHLDNMVNSDNFENLDLLNNFKSEILKIPNFDQLLCDEIDNPNYIDYDSQISKENYEVVYSNDRHLNLKGAFKKNNTKKKVYFNMKINKYFMDEVLSNSYNSNQILNSDYNPDTNLKSNSIQLLNDNGSVTSRNQNSKSNQFEYSEQQSQLGYYKFSQYIQYLSNIQT